MRSRDGSSITADEVLDTTRAGMAERLLRRHDAPFGTASIEDIAEPLSVALLKLHFLRRPLDRDVTWDEHGLWRETFPRFLRLFEAFATAEWRAWRGPRTEESDEGACCTTLLVHVETFPDVARRAFDDRDPVHLVHFLDELAALVTSSACVSHRRTWRATSMTMRRADHLLGLRLPRGFEVVDVPGSA